MAELAQLRRAIKKEATPARAKSNEWFFKTGKGEYGEGDKFVGLTMPAQRKIAQHFKGLARPDVSRLLKSKIHEERMIALLILVDQFEKGDAATQKNIFDFYLKNTQYVNNWDLVDTSAHQIVGQYLLKRSRAKLKTLAKSKTLWERRISIIATAAFINQGEFADTIAISKLLLQDEHDLIHKAVGWMLREVGNRDRKVLERFLKQHYQQMPRTMLRYAIEKFSKTERQKYLKGKI